MNNFLLPPEIPIILFPFDSLIIIKPPFDYSFAIMISPYCGKYSGLGM